MPVSDKICSAAVWL